MYVNANVFTLWVYVNICAWMLMNKYVWRTECIKMVRRFSWIFRFQQLFLRFNIFIRFSNVDRFKFITHHHDIYHTFFYFCAFFLHITALLSFFIRFLKTNLFMKGDCSRILFFLENHIPHYHSICRLRMWKRQQVNTLCCHFRHSYTLWNIVNYISIVDNGPPLHTIQ